jgi:DNA-binding transcriptional LysR family regulator
MPDRHYNMHVELRQLRYFIAVSEELNFTKAGWKLRVAQPALSRQVRQLEEEIGVQLFVRDRRSVKLTDPGRVFLEQARAVVGKASDALEMVRRAGRGEYGRVRIGIASGLASNVNRAVEAHLRQFPDVDLQCQDVFSTLQNEALHAGRIDVGFLRPPVDTKHLTSELLFEEPFLVFLSKSNPLAKRRKLRLKQIAGETLLLHERSVSTGVYDKTLELYKRSGIVPTMLHTNTGKYEEAGTLLVASGKGIYLEVGAVLSHPLLGSGIVAIPLDEPGAQIEVHVAWRKDENAPAVLAFLDSVQKVFKTSWKGQNNRRGQRTATVQ